MRLDNNLAFTEGESAYWQNISWTSNPYPIGSFEYNEWEEGWNMAYEEDTYYDEEY